jgi:hypothetical protein
MAGDETLISETRRIEALCPKNEAAAISCTGNEASGSNFDYYALAPERPAGGRVESS